MLEVAYKGEEVEVEKEVANNRGEMEDDSRWQPPHANSN